MPDINVLCMPLPELCDPCGQNLMRLAEKPNKQTEIITWCPHNHVLATAQLANHDGHPAIIHWALQGPVSEKQAMEVIKRLGDIAGTDPTLVPGPDLIN